MWLYGLYQRPAAFQKSSQMCGVSFQVQPELNKTQPEFYPITHKALQQNRYK